MRSPLAYPLNRNADADVGGAADLQTDVMRFMAILALCLVAIFALVQSLPIAPSPPATTNDTAEVPVLPPLPAVPAVPAETPSVAAEISQPVTDDIVLRRPKWVPKYPAATAESAPETALEPVAESPPPAVEAAVVQPEAEESQGFTLRFESDAALARLVASQQVGFYAINGSRAQRMAVTDSRISFWDASLPNQYHEMEPTTVPPSVSDALTRSGVAPSDVSWGVTLPGPLRRQLDELTHIHAGGALIIEAGGTIRREATE